MTKQEGIREGIAEFISVGVGEDTSSANIAIMIVDYLHSQGVVIKVERELPVVPGFTDIKPDEIDRILDAFRSAYANYEVVEPLIKE